MVLLRTSHVLPSSALRLNSFALSPCERHPVIVRVSDFPFPDESCDMAHTDVMNVRTIHKNNLFILIPPGIHFKSPDFDDFWLNRGCKQLGRAAPVTLNKQLYSSKRLSTQRNARTDAESSAFVSIAPATVFDSSCI